MKTSLLRYPKGDTFIRIHRSLLTACGGNACAAALLVFFEGWHNYKREQAEYNLLYNAMARDVGATPIIDTSGWQYHTMIQLERGVMIYKADAIVKALELLELKGFIATEVPDHLRVLHKTGRTRWFLLMAEAVNAYFDTCDAGTRPPEPVKAKVKRPRAPRVIGADDMLSDVALDVFKYRSRRRVEFWKARGKRFQPAIPDAKQLGVIMDRLKEGFTPDQLKLAFEGCLASDWHTGSNPGGTVYDSVGLVYRDSEKVNTFLTAATAAGLKLGDPAPSGAPDNRRAQLVAGIADAIVEGEAVPIPIYGLWRVLKPEAAELEPEVRAAVEFRAGMYGSVHRERWQIALEAREAMND